MSTKKLRIAIVSDLHCHPKRKKETDGDDSTYLLSDMLRTPANNHPVESLFKIIREGEEVDLVLCPGDFTDKADVQGFIAGWNYSLEINRKLKSKNIIATLGNHDVDSHNKISNYSLTTPKGIKQGFPIDDEKEQDILWSKGCVFIEKEDYRILVINSAHYHYHKERASVGEVGNDLLEYIQSYLSDKSDDKIKIAMSHHHPVDHSMLNLGENDKIVNADALLNILGDFSFDLYVHGHKHHPLLRYFNTTKNSYRLPIFSVGSFSATTNLSFTSVRNYFHVLDLTKEEVLKGLMTSWTFIPHTGWSTNFDENGFAPYTGFGSLLSVEKIYSDIVALMLNEKSLSWDKVKMVITDVENLIPVESNSLYEMLRTNGYILDKHLWQKPTLIFNTNNS